MNSKGIRVFFALIIGAGIFVLVEKSPTPTKPQAKYRIDPLSDLAVKYHADKWHQHFYTPTYHQYFKDFKDKSISLLELGIQDNTPMHLWRNYFSRGTIVGTYQHTLSAPAKGTYLYKGTQTDAAFLKMIHKKHGAFEIIIDGGHRNSGDCIQSFETLFPLLKEGGIYVVEETQTSYWKSRGGVMNPQDLTTAMNYFKARADGLNFTEIKQVDKNYLPSYMDQNIRSIHFYHNLIFILKGKNDIPSSKNIEALKRYEKRMNKQP